MNSSTLNIDLNAKDNLGQTAFHIACVWGNYNVAHILIDNSDTYSIDINAIDNLGQTALDLARAQGHDNVAKLIIELILMLKTIKARQLTDGSALLAAKLPRN